MLLEKNKQKGRKITHKSDSVNFFVKENGLVMRGTFLVSYATFSFRNDPEKALTPEPPMIPTTPPIILDPPSGRSIQWRIIKNITPGTSTAKITGTSYRSSHQRCSVRKGVLRNFAKFTGKQKQTLAQVFSCEFCEISKSTFFTEHLWATASILPQVQARNTSENLLNGVKKIIYSLCRKKKQISRIVSNNLLKSI